MKRSNTSATTLAELAAAMGPERDRLVQLAAAMQLLPDNATKWARFERLLEAALGAEPADPQQSVGPRRLRELLTQPPIATDQLLSGEDPFEETLTASISFFGGSYRVVMGGAAGAHAACQLVLNACRRLDDSLDDFRATVFAEATVTLGLSEEICRRTRLRRWERPVLSASSPLVVPDAAALDELTSCVTFNDDELSDLLGPAANVVDVLTRPGLLGLVDHDHDSPTDDRIYLYPFVRMVDGRLVVALPSGLSSALTHRALARAVDLDIAHDVVIAIHSALQSRMRDYFDRLRWRRVVGPTLDEPETFREAFYRFDADKVAHVVSVVDPLNGYQPGRPFGMADFNPIQTELHARFTEVRQAVRAVDSDTGVLHIVCIAPLGRSSFLGFTDESVDQASALLTLTSDDLDIITGSDTDPLSLWKFGVASRRLHERTRVMSFSKLDEYAIYLDHGRGFYMGDDGRPTMVTISPGSGGELRCKERTRRDDHAVSLPDQAGVVDVMRWRADDQCPIYRPVLGPLSNGHIVELEAPLWVLPAPANAAEKEATDDLAEAIAFWLWRCRAWIESAVRDIAARGEPAVLEVRFESDDTSEGESSLEPVADWLEISPTSASRIAVTMRKGAARRMQGPGNDAERLLAATLVEAIRAMSGDASTVVPSVLAELPAGPMKMFQVFGAEDDAFLTLGFTAQPRLLPAADVELLLDDIGEVLAETMQIKEGQIPAERRTPVLNDLVSHLFKRLMSRIAELDAVGLLEQLAAEQEAIAFLERRNRLLIPSQAACFGDESSPVRKARDSARDVTATAIANRFLIECVTAQPPSGERDLSVGFYDELLAIANQIVQLGYLSDAIQYGIAETDLTLLPSGRLGISRDEPYQTAVAAHLATQSGRALADARRKFERHWAGREGSSSDYDSADLDRAFAAEWGVTATQLSHLSGELIEIARAEPRQIATRHLDALMVDLTAKLDWPAELVSAALPLLSLTPLDSFPPPANAIDVYPWRFSRDRSAARRPLLHRPTPEGPEIVWGPRAVMRAGHYLLQQVLSDRLKVVRSEEMRRYITRSRQAETAAFNDEVARAFNGAESSQVWKNVKRIGNVKLARPNGDEIGDIDVLVIDVAERVVLAVETKDFEFARTPFELQSEIKKLLGENDSAVTHHSERLTFLGDNWSRLHRELGLAGLPRDWQIRGLIVTSVDLIGARFVQVKQLPNGLKLVSMADVQADARLFTKRVAVNPSTRRDRRKRRRRK